ncbi:MULTISPECIES: DUF423 domain-containing protein [unclassified Saccharibacter]|uniref:DUF423 domain-containing protein n=1 Tax=unclassified Saccharibacter TaxID=2648722 RepID=UPI001324EA81|nr:MULTISPECIES: DUF423 domain-containing protein [unclassified Saccharibacter]MXV35527.1 DUF423 domain-containing protein [Saccharibacter sp. EH611]MXV58187.1 DUF423 domain-containing protein [Saccharibacter sp. EH70]MXV65460.1 DUF423 domain-containing protein [Saccharibacter sp. EH60]
MQSSHMDRPPPVRPLFSLHTSLMLKACFAIAALMSGSSVALQAMAAHLPEAAFSAPHGRDMVHMAANIALWHGIALCALTVGAPYLHPLRTHIACLGMLLGTLLFSISVTLYGLHITSSAPPAPFGGSLLILSWLLAASAPFQGRSSS